MAKYELSGTDKRKVFWAGNIDKLPDPLRSTRWRFCVDQSIFKAVGINPTNGKNFADDIESTKDFTLHVIGGAQIPKIQTKYESIWYMGFEKRYPVQQQGLAGDMSFEALLLEDARAYETVIAWNQMCLNTGILNTNGAGDTNAETNRMEVDSNRLFLGLGQQENYGNSTAILLRNAHVTLELYDWMYGQVIMAVRFINAWPSAVESKTQFNYQTATLGKFGFTLTYDRWNLWVNPGYKVIGDG